ncbi:type IV leader peptidase family protein [Melghirimyces profundicolus]|uniref:Type IV leader peptidase family protein n=1 Tax=Melghirimyces profundicolus TaxID=1242148 RepID=A0A2T6BTT3_9BACL|nr:A24 family peptidase [Melghirimyces profundicolus]PTX59387.1 type IV leader peptidase family protein [Melghirimyces profundicolus]
MDWLALIAGGWAGSRTPEWAGRWFLKSGVGCRGASVYRWLVAGYAGAGFFLVTTSPFTGAERVLGYLLTLFLGGAAFLDLSCRRIPNRLNVTAAVLFLVFRAATVGEWLSFPVAALAGGIFLLAVSRIFRGGVGGGDIKLVAASGLALGGAGLTAGLAVAFCTGGLWALFLLFSGRARGRTPLPFAPHLAIGLLSGYLWGREWVVWYFSLLGVRV